MEGCMRFKDEYTGVQLFGFWVQCILLFKHLLSFGLSEHEQNCKNVERCLSRTIRSYALLVSHFQTTVAQHHKRWVITRKTVTNMLVKRLPRPRAVAKGYLQKRTSDFSSFFADSFAGYIESDISSDCNAWL